MPSIVALIPARTNSQRVKGKNFRLLAGKPLIWYTIEAAQQTGLFRDVYLCTDDHDLMSRVYGTVTLIGRSTVPDDQPDIIWVREALARIPEMPDAFAILRPTSPFRSAQAIRRAWDDFLAGQPCDSLRAVERATQSPFKMWQIAADGAMRPLLPEVRCEVTRDVTIGHITPYHSLPTQTLPPIYVQNASLEIAWTRVVTETGTISGRRIIPFFYPTLDINTEADWAEAERLVTRHPVEYLG